MPILRRHIVTASMLSALCSETNLCRAIAHRATSTTRAILGSHRPMVISRDGISSTSPLRTFISAATATVGPMLNLAARQTTGTSIRSSRQPKPMANFSLFQKPAQAPNLHNGTMICSITWIPSATRRRTLFSSLIGVFHLITMGQNKMSLNLDLAGHISAVIGVRKPPTTTPSKEL